LSNHLYILSELIFKKNENTENTESDLAREKRETEALNTLLTYSITTSHSKMHRRLNHRVSKLHLKSLGRVENVPFNSERVSKLHLKSLGRVKNVPFNSELQEKITNDRNFITGFVKETLTKPEMITSSIPNIQNLVKNLPPESDSFQLYTSETCTEFHNLLVELLTKFKSNLETLETLTTKAKAEDRELFKVKAEDRELFNKCVLKTLVLGHTLLKIARGSALETHLQNIETLLEDHRCSSNTEITMPKADEELDEVLNEELLPVLSYTTDHGRPMPLWKTYGDWMQLMVVHFDAAKILTTYAASRSHPYRTISFKILNTPPKDNALLPWSELLTNSRLFPAADPSGTSITNQDILDFINDGLAVIENENIGQRIENFWGEVGKRRSRSSEIIKSLERLKPISDYTESVNKIIGLLDIWRKEKKEEKEETANDISNEIRSLHERLTAKKNSSSFPIDLVLKVFHGTLHCEICLSSILHKETRDTMVADEYNVLLEETKVNYYYSDLSMRSIYCDNSIFEKLLVYQNVAVRHVACSSACYQKRQTHSSLGALTIPFRHAPYPHGHRGTSWI
jgi:hypothetical protein